MKRFVLLSFLAIVGCASTTASSPVQHPAPSTSAQHDEWSRQLIATTEALSACITLCGAYQRSTLDAQSLGAATADRRELREDAIEACGWSGCPEALFDRSHEMATAQPATP